MHVVREENHELTNTVTDNPVEEGFNVSDHSRPDPEKVTLTCLVSNTPISRKQQTQSIRSGQYTFKTTSEAAGAIGDTQGYALTFYRDLKAWRDKGEILTVTTTLETYEKMGIERISIPRNVRNYDALEFTISFKKLRIVKNKLTRNVVSKDPRAQQKKSAGAKPTQSASQDQLGKTALGTTENNSPNDKVGATRGFAGGFTSSAGVGQ